MKTLNYYSFAYLTRSQFPIINRLRRMEPAQHPAWLIAYNLGMIIEPLAVLMGLLFDIHISIHFHPSPDAIKDDWS